MLRRDITEKRSCSPNLLFPVGRVFSPQADVAGESVLGMLLCGGRSQGLVKTSWSSHLAIKCCHIIQPRFSKVTGISELLCSLGRWVRCLQLRMAYWGWPVEQRQSADPDYLKSPKSAMASESLGCFISREMALGYWARLHMPSSCSLLLEFCSSIFNLFPPSFPFAVATSLFLNTSVGIITWLRILPSQTLYSHISLHISDENMPFFPLAHAQFFVFPSIIQCVQECTNGHHFYRSSLFKCSWCTFTANPA